jgi:hypothetical protein
MAARRRGLYGPYALDITYCYSPKKEQHVSTAFDYKYLRVCYLEGRHVFEDYVIKGEKLCRVGKCVRVYDATKCPELPGAVSRIQPGNAKTLLQFARQYGHLGYATFHFDEHTMYEDDEPLGWVWSHVQTVQLVLELQEYCNAHREAWRIEACLDTYRRHMGLRDTTTDDLKIAVLGGTKVIPLPRKPHDSIYDVADKIRRCILHENTKETFSSTRGMDSTAPSKLFHGSLIEAVYWHLAQMAQKPVRPCEGCGARFIVTDAKQRHCRKSCAAAKRQRIRRERLRAARMADNALKRNDSL